MIAFVPLSGKKYPILGALAHGLNLYSPILASEQLVISMYIQVDTWFLSGSRALVLKFPN